MNIPVNKTKIVATYGPACSNEDTMLDMVKAGVDVFRFNFSHGSHEFHKEGFGFVRTINEKYNLNIAILADLQGPKIRVGEVEGDGVMLEKGEIVEITTEECVTVKGKIFIHYPNLAKDANPGEVILMDDGKRSLKVTETDGKKTLKAEVLAGGLLTSRKGVNLPNTNISVPSLTDKDRVDLEFAVENDANWIALSFVRNAKDLDIIRKSIGKKFYQKVIAKIEKPEAIKNLDAIIDATDGIMIARGDLGVEVPIERMPMIQKKIINKCIKAAKPVIVATQMMDSMIENPMPTRAEITDVANAVIDGADAVMLSGETSVGKYPIRVIEMMEKVLHSVEKNKVIYNKDLKANKKSPTFISDAICYNACKIAKEVKAKAILGMTRSGYTGFMVSSYRPRAHIFIFTEDKNMLNTLNLLWGVRAFYYDKFVSTDVTIKDVIKILKQNKVVHKDDLIVNTASMPLREQGRTNMVKVTRVK